MIKQETLPREIQIHNKVVQKLQNYRVQHWNIFIHEIYSSNTSKICDDNSRANFSSSSKRLSTAHFPMEWTTPGPYYSITGKPSPGKSMKKLTG